MAEIDGFDMIHDFPIGPMNYLHEGATKKLISNWLEDCDNKKFNSAARERMNQFMRMLSKCTPREFSKKIGPFRKKMKAAEWAQNFVICWASRFRLPSDDYNNFLCLSYAGRILSSESFNRK